MISISRSFCRQHKIGIQRDQLTADASIYVTKVRIHLNDILILIVGKLFGGEHLFPRSVFGSLEDAVTSDWILRDCNQESDLRKEDNVDVCVQLFRYRLRHVLGDLHEKTFESFIGPFELIKIMIHSLPDNIAAIITGELKIDDLSDTFAYLSKLNTVKVVHDFVSDYKPVSPDDALEAIFDLQGMVCK